MQIPFPQTFKSSLSFCGEIAYNLSVTAESSPIKYDADSNSFFVETDDIGLHDSTILVTIDSYLVDYPTISGDQVTIPVHFLYEKSNAFPGIDPNTLPYFVETTATEF